MRKKFILRLRLNMKNLQLVRSFVTQVLEYGKVPGQDSMLMEMAVNEICENIINHGYEGRGGDLDMSINLDSSRVKVTIIDRGKPYDIEEHKPKPVEELVEKGIKGNLGIMIIKKFSDKISYTRLKGKNKTVIIRELTPEKAAN